MKPNQKRFIEFLKSKTLTASFDIERTFEQRLITTFVNPYSVKQFSTEYEKLLEGFDQIYSDGQLLTNFYSKHFEDIQRISFDGNSIAAEVFEFAAKNRFKIGLVGSTDENVETASKILNDHYGEVIGYYTSGFNVDIEHVADNLARSDIKIVVFGMGQILQERALLALKKQLGDIVGFTCGGYIHQLAQNKRVQYYPDFINKYNLRSFYRVYDEGPKLAKRYLFDYQDFYTLAI